jgi:hypothetical protein
MKTHNLTFLSMLLALVALAAVAKAGEVVVYNSGERQGNSDWVGRSSPGGSNPPVVALTLEGKRSLQVTTDEKLGSGLHWNCPVILTAGAQYKVSFKIKLSATEPVVCRVTDEAGTSWGAETHDWHGVPYKEKNLGTWVQYNLVLTPVGTRIGLDIAAAANHEGYPFEITVTELKLTKL